MNENILSNPFKYSILSSIHIKIKFREVIFPVQGHTVNGLELGLKPSLSSSQIIHFAVYFFFPKGEHVVLPHRAIVQIK